MNPVRRDGIGMTSARTRERLVARLKAEGIRNEAVLERMRVVPRHPFLVSPVELGLVTYAG